MRIHVTNLEFGNKLLTKTLPPIRYSINRDRNVVSLTEELNTPRRTRGSTSKIALAFYAFLFDRGEALSYIHNVFRYNDSRLVFQGLPSQLNPRDYVNSAFSWSSAPEGSDYWSVCDNAWRDHLEELRQNT